jgi:hypothetical protein
MKRRAQRRQRSLGEAILDLFVSRIIVLGGSCGVFEHGKYG